MSTAVIVGSGPNGLAAAIRLASAGLEVTVLEASERPGGGSRTSESTLPGLRHDECAAFHPLGAASPYFASLGLERHGLRWRWPEVDLAHPLDDGRAGIATRDLDATASSLGPDGARWRRLVDGAVRHVDDLLEEVLQPVLHRPRHPVTLGRFGLTAALPATVVAGRFRDDPAAALFVGLAAHRFGRLDRPLTSAIGLLLATTAHTAGWPVAAGGSESITRALVAELQTYGGTVVTGVRVRDLGELSDFTADRPDLVLLDTAPAGTLEIVGDRLPHRVRRAFTRYAYGPAAFKLDLAIEGDVPWANPDCRRAGTLHLGGTAAEIAAVEAATTRGEMPERPYVLVGQQYLADPSRSAGTTNPIYAYAHVPHGYAADATEAIIGQIERFAPGFRDRILAVSRRGPAELEAYNPNYVGGDIATGAHLARQIVFRPRIAGHPYRLGVPGVYLCSQATPPGAGVHGMAGFHAAGAALADLRRPGRG